MSTTVDQRVVEMRFDNQNFEKNVSNTLSTLDKLKQKLNLTGASKGLEDVNAAAKRVDMNGLGRGIETVSARFSAMQVVGITALSNIANQAVNTSKRMISALTLDPVTTGFREYETQINAVQTILANTSAKGTDINDVNKALEELNQYADKTIYNFTEMTRNIGTFTAAGVDLDTSVNAIQGIANLAAISGSNSQQASTAMYQLSQALAAGTVKLMDWNSVVNAGMGGEVFQNALKETARVHGIAIDDMIKEQGSFRETLSEGWITSEILTETLQKFTLTTEGLTEAQIEQNREMLRGKGYTEQQIDEIFKLGKTSTDAATKVKTFTQLWDVMKESAQSGWSQTWKLIIGDFEEAKSLLTPLSDFFTNAINKMSEARNRLLEGALGKTFTKLADSVKDAIRSVGKSADSVKEIVKTVDDYSKVVDDIMSGVFGNGQERWDKLAEAGYDWAHAQNLVNEKLGSGVRHASDYKEAADKASEANKDAAKATGELTEAEIFQIERLTRMSDAYLKSLGYTDQQIKALRELKEVADKLGLRVTDLLKNIDQIDGRWLVVNSFKTAGKAIVDVFSAIGKAWRETFEPMKPDTLFDFIAGMHRFTQSMKVSHSTSQKITRTFKGLFAIIDLITTLVGGGFKIAFKLITSVLKYFNLDILDVTAAVGDAIVKFRDWVDGLFDVSGILDAVIPLLSKGAETVSAWFTAFKNSEGFQNYIKGIKDAFTDLGNIDFASIGTNIVEGFSIGIVEGVKRVINGIANVAKEIIDVFCAILGINSPSTVFMAIGGFIIAGLVLGLTKGLGGIPETVKNIAEKCAEAFKAIDWNTIYAVGITAASLLFIKKITDALEALASPLEGMSDIFEATAKTIKKFGKIGSATANNINSKALRNLVISIGLLAGVVVALMYFFIKNEISAGAIAGAVGLVVGLAAALIGIAWAMGQISNASVDIDAKNKKIDVKGLSRNLLPIAASVLIVAAAVKLISTLSVNEAVGAFFGVGLIMAAMLVFLTICEKVTSGLYDKDMVAVGKLMTKMAIAMMLMVGVCKLAGQLSPEEMRNGAKFAAGFAIFVLAMVGVHRLAGARQISKLGGMMVKLAIAMALMIGVCKLVNVLEAKDVIKGVLFATAFILFVKALVKSTKIGLFERLPMLGFMLLSMSISMLLMIGVAKLAGMLTVEDMIKGALFMAAFVLFVKGLVWATKIGTEQQLAKVSLMMLSLSFAVTLLALVCVAMSLLSVKQLAKGIIAVGLLTTFMTMMIKATKGAQNIRNSLLIMAIAIGVMAAAVAGLSFIDTKKLAAATLAMGVLMGMFAVMIKSAKTIEKSMGTAIVLSAALVVMAGVLWLLSTLDVKASLENAAALSLLMLAMSGALTILSKMKDNLMTALKGVGLLLLMALPMVAFVGVLGDMEDLQTPIKNVALLVGLMAAMTGLLALLGLIGKFGMKAFVGVLALSSMWVPMYAFVDILTRMQNLTKADQNVTALTKLMWNMAGLLAVMTIIGAICMIGGGLGGLAVGLGILALSLMFIPMRVFIDELARMENIKNAGVNVHRIIELMTTMTDLLTRLAIIGPFALIGEAALVGLIGIMIAVGGLVAAIGKLDELTGGGLTEVVERGIPLLIKLAEGVGLMIGKFAGGMIEGVSGSIVTLMESLKDASVHAAGIESGSFEGVKEFIGVLGDLSKTMVGNDWRDIFIRGDGDSIDKFQEDGVKFFKALGEISKHMNEATSSVTGYNSYSGIISLLDTLKQIGQYSVGIQWKDWLVRGEDDAIDKFKTDATKFFKTMGEISKSMKEVAIPAEFDTTGIITILTCLKDISKAMVGVQFADMFVNKFGGDADSIAKFKTDASNFFYALNGISTVMKLYPVKLPEEFNVGDLTGLLDALKEVSSSMVGISFADFFTTAFSGDEGAMEKFKADGRAFFEAMHEITTVMQEYPTKLPDNFSVGDLTGFLDALSAVGTYTMGESWKQAFSWFGTPDAMTNFKDDGVNFFKAIHAMMIEAEGISSAPFMVCKVVIARIKEVIASVADIDYSGVEEFTGIGTGGFGADGPMHDIAVAIKDFGTQLAGVDVVGITIAATAVGKIRTVIANLAGLDTSGVANYKKAIEDLSKVNLDGFVKAFNVSLPTLTGIGTGMVDALVNGIRSGQAKLATVTASVVGSLGNVVRSKQSALTAVGTTMLDGMINGMRSRQNSLMSLINAILSNVIAHARGKASLFSSTGNELMSWFVRGMSQNSAHASTALNSSIASAVASARSHQGSFYSAGQYLADGFAGGISANSYKAAAQAAAMANAAEKAAKEALGIKSPSRVFYGIGEFTGEGFINALKAYGSKVYNAGSDMADNARNGLADAIGKATDLLNGTADVQPTIRPILDLSDVRAGAGAINGMFGSSVGLSANIGAISSAMNRNQNGGNDDVISAIDKLRDSMSNLGSNTYNINGVSVGDDAAVVAAFETIIRAAQVERRS